jgi:hypothetical protein
MVNAKNKSKTLRQTAVTASILIDVSEMHIDALHWSGEDEQRQVVRRMCATPAGYRQWLSFHSGLMRHVGGTGSRQAQIATMRQKSFELIHRQALFQYLRDNSLPDESREAVVAAFHGSREFRRALVAEHARYLQSNSSLYCTRYLNDSILRDASFGRGLDGYAEVYMDFFDHYCSWLIAESRDEKYMPRYLIPAFKAKLTVMKSDLLALPLPVAERRRKPRRKH